VSGIAAIAGSKSLDSERLRLDRILAAMSARGEHPQESRFPAGSVAAVRHEWETAPLSLVSATRTREVAVAADCSLYYRAELVGALRSAGVDVDPDSGGAALLGAAFLAWDDDCARRVEGDFAFVVYDPNRRLLFAARDFCGRRPLFYARVGDDLLVASSVAAILAHPEARRAIDLSVVAASAAGLFALRDETCYLDVKMLPPGHSLTWREGRLNVRAFWVPPPVERRGSVAGMGLEEGAERLRELLVSAVGERLDTTAPTAVWMSGGWDSTGVYGCGNLARQQRGLAKPLRPVSIRYPVDDPGHEDEWIQATADLWGGEPHWLDIADIPLFVDPERRAAERDEPFAHVFENWNRSLAHGSARSGANIALDGVGGDHLFQMSIVYLAELLKSGRLFELRREWSSKGMRGWKDFVRWAVLPLLSRRVDPVLTLLRGGRPVPGYLERPVPSWMREDFLRSHGVLDRERRNTPDATGHGPVAYETLWYLTHPFGGRVLSTVSGIALEEGIEVRSPLMDARLVEFALSRPWAERSYRNETKRLLRYALRGLVPDSVLAPRRYRTGTTSGYLLKALPRWKQILGKTFECPTLAELGIVDAKELSRACSRFYDGRDEDVAVALIFSFQTELWMRARL
jgi:asparagine synthase (glutamine-hydrolysing)